MTNREKAINVLAIIMEELNMPKGATVGDVARALQILDPSNEIINLLKPFITKAVIEEIQLKIA